MLKQLLFAVAALVLGMAAASTAAREIPAIASELPRQPPPGQPEAGFYADQRDTVWFGGDDGLGVAFEGGIWDWDAIVSDSLQGWTAVDYTQNPAVYFYRVTEDDFLAHGDPCVPITEGGMLWCGVHEDEALLRGFEAGMGYQNYMCQWAHSPMVTLVPPPQASELLIDFSYFNHTEGDFDYTHVYLHCFDENNNLLDEPRLDSFTGVIGSPEVLEVYSRIVPYDDLPPGTHSIQLELYMKADWIWSDEDGLWDSPCGPFGLDDASLTMGATVLVWDFDDDAQGWTFDRCPGKGNYMGLFPEETWGPWLDSLGLSDCPLNGNVWEFVDEEESPFWPPGIALLTYQIAVSGPVPRGPYNPTEWPTTVMRWGEYTNNAFPFFWFRKGYMYYPYTTPQNPLTRWSPRMGQDLWWIPPPESQCHQRILNLSTHDGHAGRPIPDEWDSMKVVFEVLAGEEEPVNSVGAPLLDNVQVGLVGEWSGVVEDRERNIAAHVTRLIGAQPNPFAMETTIRFRLAAAGPVALSIYDVMGRVTRRLVDKGLEMGEHTRVWDGTDDAGEPAGTGIFWVKLETGDGHPLAKRLLLLE